MPTFPPLHQDLTFLSPLSDERAGRLVAFLTEHEPATALDVGCGWAELLLRARRVGRVRVRLRGRLGAMAGRARGRRPGG